MIKELWKFCQRNGGLPDPRELPFLIRGQKRINGLALPERLLQLARENRWRLPEDTTRFGLLFPAHGKDAKLYSLHDMFWENRGWRHRTDPQFLGTQSSGQPPGDIDPVRSLIIGDLGAGWDSPIVLDYRNSRTKPSVATLVWGSKGGPNYWKLIADDVMDFARKIGIIEPEASSAS